MTAGQLSLIDPKRALADVSYVGLDLNPFAANRVKISEVDRQLPARRLYRRLRI